METLSPRAPWRNRRDGDTNRMAPRLLSAILLTMRLWLDDEREPPGEEWFWAFTYAGAIGALESRSVIFASLDHDLGARKTGYDVVLWMCEHNIWPPEGVIIHSWNIPSGNKMAQVVDRYGPYATRCRHIPFYTTDISQV